MGRIRVPGGGGREVGVWSHLLKSICASQKVLPSGAFKTNLNDNYINVNVPCPSTHLTLICICALSRLFFFSTYFSSTLALNFHMNFCCCQCSVFVVVTLTKLASIFHELPCAAAALVAGYSQSRLHILSEEKGEAVAGKAACGFRKDLKKQEKSKELLRKYILYNILLYNI